MTATDEYIDALTRLKPGELGLLRSHAGQGLDESVDGFDLFAGLWWPLRQKNERAPRREVAWLIAKLYAFAPIPSAHLPDGKHTLARQLRRCQPHKEDAIRGFQQQFNQMLALPLSGMETALQWALGQFKGTDCKLDWVKLTDDLSRWENEQTRLDWAEQFLEIEREQQC